MKPLTSIAEINPPLLRKVLDDEIVSFIGMADISEEGAILNNIITEYGRVKNGFTRFSENDTLFAKITPCMENGKGALVTKLVNGIGCGSTEFHVLRAKKGGDPSYIYHVTMSQIFRLKAEMNMTGSAGQRRVPSDFFKEFNVYIPSFKTQQKIAKILTTIDQLIEKTQALIDKHTVIKQGMMADLFTRGIDPTTGQLRPPVEQAPQLYKETELGWVPKEWDVGVLNDFLKNIEQGWSPDCDSKPAQSGHWGVLKTTAVVWTGFNCCENKALPVKLKPRLEYEVKVGDVLMTRAGPGNRVGVVACIDSVQIKLMLSDKLYRIVSNEKLVNEYLAMLLSSAAVQRQLNATKTGLAESQSNISQDIVKKLLIIMPDKKEQEIVVERVKSITSKIKTEQAYLNKLNVQKKGLMQDLLTGKVKTN